MIDQAVNSPRQVRVRASAWSQTEPNGLTKESRYRSARMGKTLTSIFLKSFESAILLRSKVTSEPELDSSLLIFRLQRNKITEKKAREEKKEQIEIIRGSVSPDYSAIESTQSEPITPFGGVISSFSAR